MTKVSVILPVYNESECIEKTLYSVFDYLKTRPNYDFLFVNDGSNDETQFCITGIKIALCPTNFRFGSTVTAAEMKTWVEFSAEGYIPFLNRMLRNFGTQDRLQQEYGSEDLACR